MSVSGIEELQALEARYAMPTYARAPVEFVRGRGCLLWDSEGREYIDFFSGLSVHNAGHCHPAIVAAVRDQVGELAGSSNLYYSSPAIQLHAKLSEASLGGRVFLCNSGTEANECAIKLARRHAHQRGVDRPEIVVLDGGFHGRTLGALSATVRLADEELFGPLLEGFVLVPRDDPTALGVAVGERTAAVLLEPVQGEAGVHPIGDDVLGAAREACDRSGALLVFDEIQTGMGRTGELWAYELGPAMPDVLTAAKALGGGLPVGACVTAPAVGEGLGLGEHGSTFGGGSVAARAALAALEVLSEPSLLASVRDLGKLLERRCVDIDGVEQVRRRGLMVGLGLRDGIDSREVAEAALQSGLVVNAPNPRTVRLLPPLVVAEAEVIGGCDRLAEALERTRRNAA